MKIRKAKVSDAKQISKLIQDTAYKIGLKEYPKEVIDLVIRKNTPREWGKRIKKSDVFCLVDKQTILGTAELDNEIIGKFYVKHNLLRKGIGEKLLNFIEEYALNKKIKKLKLYSTTIALKFYKKQGYKLKKNKIWNMAGHKVKVPVLEKTLK